MTDNAPDLFGHRPAQGDLFGGEAPAVATPKVDPSAIRVRLHAMLGEMRALREGSPWSPSNTRLNQLIFPQMANWLPTDERSQLRNEFDLELERLGLK